MKLMTDEIKNSLLDKYYRQNLYQDSSQYDPMPVVKYFTPWSDATWLIVDMNPEDQDTMFGLCDLGLGMPELGYVSLRELETLQGPLGLKVERDIHWKAEATIGTYADLAKQAGRFVEPYEFRESPPSP